MIRVAEWPCGDRSYGRGRLFRAQATYRRLRWHWQHRREGGVRFPPRDWWRWPTTREQRRDRLSPAGRGKRSG